MDLVQVVAIVGVLGAGTIGGVFFAFSSFVMPALGRLPSEQGLAAMQSINVAVLHPSFLAPFVGTALLSLFAVVLAGMRWSEPGAEFLAAGGAIYLVGTFLVTGLGNVPLNEDLESADPSDARAPAAWERYARRWTNWNHLRTAAALVAALCFFLGA